MSRTVEALFPDGATVPSRTPAAPQPYPPPVVMLRCGDSSLVGFAESLTEAEVRVQALEELPDVAGDCEVVLDFAAGRVTARGSVSRIDANARSFCVSIDRVVSDGDLLLAATAITQDIEDYSAKPNRLTDRQDGNRLPRLTTLSLPRHDTAHAM